MLGTIKRNTMKAALIFNPAGDDSVANRSIWYGTTTNLMNLNSIRYKWALGLYQQMRENFWIPQRIDLTQDITDYGNLTQDERRSYDGILSYLTFLDSIQTCNIPHLKGCITAPEVGLCMAEQISQEALHNQSYQYLIETIIPSDRREAVYDFWRTDGILKERCQFIAHFYQDYIDNPTPKTYFTALIADYLLEGLYFYNGFQFYYTLASRQLMPGTADMFKMINRDELSHVRLYQELVKEARSTINSVSDPEISDMFAQAVAHECSWSCHILGGNILGITSDSIKEYTKYIANIRLRAIGLKPLYPGAENPYKHLENIADTSKHGNTKANFFESAVTSYTMSSGVSGWDTL